MTIIFLFIMVSFVFGFVWQGFIRKGKNKNDTRMNSYDLFFWIIMQQTRNLRLSLSISKKAKRYKKLVNEPLDIQKLINEENSLVRLLSDEPNEIKMKRILEVIIEKQERARRIAEKDGNFFSRRVFFVPNLVIQNGYFKGYSVPKLILYKIQFNRFVKGYPTSNLDMVFAVNIFGGTKAREVLRFEQNIRKERDYFQKRWMDYKIQSKKKVQ